MRPGRVRVVAPLVLALALAGCSDDDAAVGTMRDGSVECDATSEGPAALVAVEPSTGELRWRRSAGDQRSAALVGGVVGIRGPDGIAVALDVGTGELRWCHRFGEVHRSDGVAWVQPDPVAADNLFALVTSSGEVVGVDPSTGETRWETSVEPTEGLHLAETADGVALDDAAADRREPIAVLDSHDGSRVGHTASADGSRVLETTSIYQDLRQEMDLAVLGEDRETLWSSTVPGFNAQLIDDLVAVLDQTQGTGVMPEPGTDFNPGGLRTSVTGYDASDGEQRWSLEVSGTPQEVFDAGPLVIVASGPQLLAIDASGRTAWSADHGSPGTGSAHRLPGTYHWVSFDPVSNTIVGLIRAEPPYRD